MKRTISTHQLLTMGLALYADKRSMEQRVRGIFGRSRTAGFARVLAALLCLVVFVGGFTTACVPARETATDGNAKAMNMDMSIAMPTPSPIPDAEAADEASLYEQYLESSKRRHQERRAHVAPLVDDDIRKQRGDWSIDETAPEADAQAAIAALLPICNALFDKDFTAEQMRAVYYRDNSGHRADIWRITSKDDALVAAIEAETLSFISADCVVEPGETLHESIRAESTGDGSGPELDSLSSKAVVERVTKVLGGTVVSGTFRGGSIRSRAEENRGWNVLKNVAVELEDGRGYVVSHHGDEALTIESVGVCPDSDCMQEGVYWRADLVMSEDVMVLANPQDFRKGEPGAGDMTEQAVFDFYKKLLAAANGEKYAEPPLYAEPNLTFYEDHSGVRENYWHVEGSVSGKPLIFNIAAKSGHIFQLNTDGALGYDMGLREIPYEEMGGEEYLSATKKLFEALFGEGSVVDVTTNAVYDGSNCTVDPAMSNGTAYEIRYQEGVIVEITFFATRTGDDKFGTDPNWAADWIYLNTETGETFHMEW